MKLHRAGRVATTALFLVALTAPLTAAEATSPAPAPSAAAPAPAGPAAAPAPPPCAKEETAYLNAQDQLTAAQGKSAAAATATATAKTLAPLIKAETKARTTELMARVALKKCLK
jgi:hypothetical protein